MQRSDVSHPAGVTAVMELWFLALTCQQVFALCPVLHLLPHVQGRVCWLQALLQLTVKVTKTPPQIKD